MSFFPCCAIAIGGSSPSVETDADKIRNILKIVNPKIPT